MRTTTVLWGIMALCVVGGVSACRHEPELGSVSSVELTRPGTISSTRTSACVVTEGDASASELSACRSACAMQGFTASLGKSLLAQLDAGAFPDVPMMTALPLADGGAQWLTVTALGDGGVRCARSASR